MSRRFAIQAAAVIALVALMHGQAPGQPFPSKQVRIFVSQPAGTGPDITTRLYADAIGQSLGQRLIVENRIAGGGVAAAVALTQSPPDGHTLLLAMTGVHSFMPAIENWPFDPIRDFEAVTMLYASSGVFMVPAASPVTSMSALIALAQSKPGGANFGSPAHGSPAHLMGVLLARKAGVPMTHVPYRGGGAMLVDFLSGQIDFTSLSYVQAKSLVGDGKARALAVAGPERLPGLPQVPTLAEAGFGDVAIQSWFGIVAPKGTPDAVRARLREEFIKASNHPLVIKRMADENLHIRTGGSRDELVRLIADDIERLGPVVRALGLKAQ